MHMTAALDPSPRPSYAVTMWADLHNIYVELPMSAAGCPYIMTFALSEGGLSAALNVLRARLPEVPKPTYANPINYTIPHQQPMVKHSKAQERLHAETTEAQRENARKLLVKLGLK